MTTTSPSLETSNQVEGGREYFWSHLSAQGKKNLLIALVSLGVIAAPKDAMSQTDLQTRFANNINGQGMTVGQQKTTITNADWHYIQMANGQGDRLRITVDHIEPDVENDVLMSSGATGPTAQNSGSISEVQVFQGDQVIVEAIDAGSSPDCDPTHYSDDNTLNITDARGGEGTTNANACVMSSSPLPIELVKFIARCEQDGQQVRVSRETASELNNKGFFVQKSSDGKTWSNIAWVDGAGSASGLNSYSLIDEEDNTEDADGVVYYRLEQQDNDGSTTYSKVEAVKNCGEGYEVQISPNPVRDILEVQISAPDKAVAQQVQLFGVNGQPLSPQISAGDPGTVRLDMSALQPGVYFVRVTSGNGDLVTEKIVKQ